MKYNKKIMFIIIPIVIIGYFLIKKDESNNFQYITETVKHGDIINTVLATGTISPYQKVLVGAQASGQIDELNAKLGQKIKKGDLIAKIDSTQQQNELDTAISNMEIYNAQLSSKKISLNIAQKKYNRQLNLIKQGASSKQDLEDAESAFALARSDVDVIRSQIVQAKIAVSKAKTNLGYTQITSPLDGIIVSVPVEQGQTVNSNQTTPTIVEIADMSKVIIKPEISEGDINKVKAGMEVEFSIIADPDDIMKTTLISVDPGTTTLTDGTSSTSSSSSTSNSAIYYYGNMIVSNENDKLRISMTTQNTIIVEKIENVLIVPNTTIKNKNGKTYVSIFDKKLNKEEDREIKTGAKDSSYTQIISGLKEGDEIVSSKTDGEINTPVRRGRM